MPGKQRYVFPHEYVFVYAKGMYIEAQPHPSDSPKSIPKLFRLARHNVHKLNS